MEKKKILIVDDEADFIYATKGVLEEAGYSVGFADNAEEALNKLNKFNPDLVLLDLVLPDKSGFQVAQKIKATDKYKDIPIIAVSGKKELVDKHIAAKSGAIEYIEKPIDIQRLLFRIKDILNI